MQKPLIKLFGNYSEAFRYLLRYIEVHEKLVPYLAEKNNAFGLLIYDFPKKDLKVLNLAAEKSCVKVTFPTMLELAPEYIKVLLIGNEYDFKNLAKELKNYETLKDLAVSIIETIHRYKKENFRIVTNRRVLPLGLKTAVMGILNVTPDSFSDGGEAYPSIKTAVEKGLKMALEGADIIDVGGESTRPGAKPVDTEEELRRVVPVVKELRKELDRNKLQKIFISVDTYKSEVANAALQEGADIINDISGGTFDENILRVVVRHRAPFVLNHTKGKPESWKRTPITYTDVVKEIVRFWERQVEKLMEMGYPTKEHIILDPGIGFGKLPEHNIEILKRFGEFKVMGQPLMVGVSRKSFIGYIYEQLLNKRSEPKERLFGSLGAIAQPVLKGAHIVRVHDVKETREFLAVLDTIKTYDPYYFA